MSKTSFSWLNSLCDLSFIRSSDLRKSSLNPSSTLQSAQTKCKTEKSRTTSPLKDSVNSRKSSCQEAKRECSSPNRGDRDKASVTEKDFRIMQVLRSGKNWRTYMVKRENEDKLYAMKLIGKKKMTMSCVTERVSMEKEIMEKAKHPFIPKLSWYFENDKKIFFVMEFVEGGGTLHHMLRQLSRFSEEITRFYSAEILLTLEYLHSDLQVAYSDLRLRDLLLDSQGHIKLIDYSQAKRLPHTETTKDLIHSNSTEPKEASAEELEDYWKLGSLIYELLTGRKPFSQEDEASGADEVSPTSHLAWPCPVSKNAKDLITRLLNRYTDKSMSFHSIDEIKKHAFFVQVNWEKMLSKSIYPPLIPTHCDDNKDCESGDEDEEESEVILKCLKTSSLDRVMESSSILNSEDGNDAVSFDRTTCMNSRLGYY